MQNHGGLICQQPVTLSISSNTEIQNVIAVARSERPTSLVYQQKREDMLSQEFTHVISDNQYRQQTQSNLNHILPNVRGQIQEQLGEQGKIFENFYL